MQLTTEPKIIRRYENDRTGLTIFTIEREGTEPHAASQLFRLWPETRLGLTDVIWTRDSWRKLRYTLRHYQLTGVWRLDKSELHKL